MKRISLAVCVAAALAGALVTATAALGASSSTSVSRGGTLRLNASDTDYEYIDPALAYDAIGWATLYAVNMMLLNYPDKPASAGGNLLVPEAAAGFPTVSKDGKTYVFTVRNGLRFSDGSNVTAAAFARAITRACHPDQSSPAVAFVGNVQGCLAFNSRQGQLSGVRAQGRKLTVRLVQADPTFLAQIAMPFFAAVKPNMPINARGENVYPSAGPYRIVSREPRRSLVLERNRFYRGSRPANPDRIVVTVNTDQNQSLLQTRAGQADYDLNGVPGVANAQLADEFGVNKGRYFVNPLLGTGYIALNTARPTFRNVKARQAVNYAVDRPALLRTRGKFGGARTDQILPPQLPGFLPAKLYPLTGAQPAKARELWPNGGEINFLHTTSSTSVALAQVAKYNLEQAGFRVTLKPQPFGVAINTMGTRGNEIDAFSVAWIADYFDPFDFINVLLDGRSIQERNNNNYSYWNSPKYNRLMDAASKLTGEARYTAYGKLDVDIMRNAAPWIPVFTYTSRDFISPRVENFIFHPVYGRAVINALAIKK
jgi:peptide/nickel transport system substrate-binding protein